MGFSLYSNGSIARDKVIENAQTNCATGNCTGGLWVPNAPNATLAYGVIYNRYGFYASLLDKRVGHTYGDVGETQPISSYSVLNGALGYTFGDTVGWIKGASIKVAAEQPAETRRPSSHWPVTRHGSARRSLLDVAGTQLQRGAAGSATLMVSAGCLERPTGDAAPSTSGTITAAVTADARMPTVCVE